MDSGVGMRAPFQRLVRSLAEPRLQPTLLLVFLLIIACACRDVGGQPGGDASAAGGGDSGGGAVGRGKGSCTRARLQQLSAYSTTDSVILTAHATSVQFSVVCEADGRPWRDGPLYFRLDDAAALHAATVIDHNRFQASWKSVGAAAPAATFHLRLYGEQAAVQLRRGGVQPDATGGDGRPPVGELGALMVRRPAAAREPCLAAGVVALAAALMLAASAITSRAAIVS